MSQTKRDYVRSVSREAREQAAREAPCRESHIGPFRPGRDRETGAVAKGVHFCNQCGNRVIKKDFKALGLN